MNDQKHWPFLPSFNRGDIDAAFRVLTWVQRELNDDGDSLPIATENPHLVRVAKNIRTSRVERSQYFETDLFGEASWDILLALYIARHEGYVMKTAVVCYESGVPATTAIRWIDRLAEDGYVIKRPNPVDARSTLLELSDNAEAKLTCYLQRVSLRNMAR